MMPKYHSWLWHGTVRPEVAGLLPPKLLNRELKSTFEHIELPAKLTTVSHEVIKATSIKRKDNLIYSRNSGLIHHHHHCIYFFPSFLRE